MDSSYRIIDEPRPTSLGRIAVNPLWIFLTCMLGGMSIGLAWFVLNSFAIGSATTKREIAYAAAGVLGSTGFYVGSGVLAVNGVLDAGNAPYAMVVLIVFQLLIAYLLHMAQHPSFELFEAFGGEPKNGVVVLIAAAVLRPFLSSALGPWAPLLL